MGSLALFNSQLTLQVTDFELEELDILETLLVLNFSFCEGDLEDLNLLIQKSQLIVSTDKLSTQDIPLNDGLLMLLPCSLMLNNSFTDDDVQFLDLGGLLLKEFIGDFPKILFNLECLLGLLLFLHIDTKLVMFSCQGLVLGLNLILKLSDLILSNFEFLSQFNDFIICLNQVLTVKISIRTDNFIQVLLLLQLALKFDVLFLELTD